MSVVDLHTSLFSPLESGEPFVVLVAALPIHLVRAEGIATSILMVGSADEAGEKCKALARKLHDLVEERGHIVRSVHCRLSPACDFCGN